jgi:hypothetical protein
MGTFLKTYEISTEILDIIVNSRSYCYIISPYIKIWPQLERVLEIASKSNKFITFVVRDDIKVKELIEKLNKYYGFEVIVVKDIHIKAYFNESKGLISTMNLYDASQHNNLEIAYPVAPSLLKKEIVDAYILQDVSVKHYHGKFETLRQQKLETVNQTKKILEQQGYCVDCKKRIEPDYNPWNARYIRCKDCYYACKTLSDKINYCHYCGENIKSDGDNPFHTECRDKIMAFRRIIKDYK